VEKCFIARLVRDDGTEGRMRFACWIPKTTGKNLEYEILIAFSIQQWIIEGALLLRLYKQQLSC